MTLQPSQYGLMVEPTMRRTYRLARGRDAMPEVMSPVMLPFFTRTSVLSCFNELNNVEGSVLIAVDSR